MLLDFIIKLCTIDFKFCTFLHAAEMKSLKEGVKPHLFLLLFENLFATDYKNTFFFFVPENTLGKELSWYLLHASLSKAQDLFVSITSFYFFLIFCHCAFLGS